MLTQKCELLYRSGTHRAVGHPESDPEQAGAALLTCRLQAAVWFCLALSTCPWVTSCKKGHGSADRSKKATFLKCGFACFSWNWCVRILIHPLSTAYSSSSLFCRTKPRSVKRCILLRFWMLLAWVISSCCPSQGKPFGAIRYYS